MTKPIHVAAAAAPVLTKLALQELDVCIERLRSVRNVLAQQFAPPGQDTPPTAQEQEPKK